MMTSASSLTKPSPAHASSATSSEWKLPQSWKRGLKTRAARRAAG